MIGTKIDKRRYTWSVVWVVAQDVDDACGGVGFRIEEPSEIVTALEKAFASEKPSLLDVRVDPKELIIPPRITLEQAANFGLAMVKEFLS